MFRTPRPGSGRPPSLRWTQAALALALAVAALLRATAANAQLADPPLQTPLAPNAIPQFVDPLPLLSVQGGPMETVISSTATIHMCEMKAHVLPTGTFVPGAKPETWVWGYVNGPCPGPADPSRETYIGPVFVATRGTPTQVTWVNELGNTATSKVLAWTTSTDQTIHWADPVGHEQNMCAHMPAPPQPGDACFANYAGPIPTVVHLHGGEVPSVLDGGPDAWFTSDGAYHGHGYYSFPAGAPNAATYTYPNVQQAAPLWFHDHTLGATRLNVYAGLAGAYVLTDPANPPPANLPGAAEIVPVILQDRSFDTSGQLLFQAGANGGALWALNPEHPYWSPELVGDVIVVNGKVWPYLDVEPRRYRFLFLNGSNARTYELALVSPTGKGAGPGMYVIGNDGGFLDVPAFLDPALKEKLLVMPGERYEVIVDFGALAPGTTLLMKNTAKTPFPGGETPQGSTLGHIMQLRVVACASGRCGANDTSYDPAGNVPLRSAPIERLSPADVVTHRQLTLNEVIGEPENAIDPRTGELYPGGPLEVLLNNTKWSGMSSRTYGDFTPVNVNGTTTLVTEFPQEGVTEEWEIVNLTADAHPIHLHLAQFQILSRQAFDVRKYERVYENAFLVAPGCNLDDCPGFGPPNAYGVENADGAIGGNPAVSPFLKGPPKPPAAQETGWKDTFMVPPGMVSRLLVRWTPLDATATGNAFYPFDPSDGNGYVWHCHIIDHEDNEMMRPDFITASPSPTVTRTVVRGVSF